MSWSEQVFRYCERGQDPAFWAEPFNALSNAGFLLAAGLMWRRIQNERGQFAPSDRAILLALTGLVALIGIGSFLFHTFATRWSRTADVAPIGAFMAAYLVMSLRMFLGWSWSRTLLALAGFLGFTAAAASIACPVRLQSITDYAREPCLKGSMGYIPALAALAITGLLLRSGHPALRYLLWAAGLFAAAIVLRWIDRDVCSATVLFGRVRGTHALWHVINAATVYLLMTAALAASRQPKARRD